MGVCALPDTGQLDEYMYLISILLSTNLGVLLCTLIKYYSEYFYELEYLKELLIKDFG